MPVIAGQTHDLVINGDGFMLAGTTRRSENYKKTMIGSSQVGLTPASTTTYETLQGAVAQPIRSFRRAIWSRWSGLGQGIVAGGDGWEKAQMAGRVYDLVSLRPVQNGGALALVPQGVSAQVDASVVGVNAVYSVSLGGLTVVSFNTKIYVSSNPGTNSSGFTLLATAAANVNGMCVWNNQVLLTEGTTLKTLNTGTGALTAFTPAQACTQITAYQGVLVAQSGAQLVFLINGAWVAGPVLENSITAFEELNGSLYIGTQTVLYRLDGGLQPSSPSTAPNTLNYFNYKISIVWRTTYQPTNFWPESNFSQMTAWKGYLWFFANNRLYRAAPVQGHDTMQPEPQPISGLSVGMRVCGSLLVLVTRLTNGGLCTIWANDGSYDLGQGLGWFKLATGGQWFFPFPNAGYPSGMVNVANNTGANTSFTRFLVDPISPVGWNTSNYGVARTTVSGKVTLPLITPEDLAQLAGATNGKVLAVNLRRVGVEWSLIDGGSWWPSVPPDAATIAAFNLVIETSNNSGVTWTTLVEPATGTYSLNLFWFYGNRVELPVGSDLYAPGMMYPAAPPTGSPLPFGPVPDSGWLIRVTWGGLVMPLLRRVWLDYDVIDIQPQTGREWEIEVNLQDPQLELDGTVDPGDAAYKIARISSLAKGGQSVTFYDLDGQAYLVKVTGFDLKRVAPGALPSLAPGWQGLIKLEEVWPGN